jgi:NTP pyrophosphatase (non-canonical NTP hydrolase)
MSEVDRDWLGEFALASGGTDRFRDRSDHAALLAAGMMGEAGSVLAELKKEQRERDAYPAYRGRMLEELGDFLWYFVRLAEVVDPGMPALFASTANEERPPVTPLMLFLLFGASVGDVLAVIANGGGDATTLEARARLLVVWQLLNAAAAEAGVSLRDAARHNLQKTASRWPSERSYLALFDDDYPEEEQLPRLLEIEFRERARGEAKVVILRCNGINFGDRLTDNIEDPDGYRYHDVFHFAHAAHLGWSPVVRALLRCKRKSNSKVDEGQDGARAAILEEAVSAIVFSRAKQLGFFDGVDHVDFDLLKSVKEFVQGFEVDQAPFWQWERAIIDGYRIFRLLRTNRGGRLTLDLRKRELRYFAPT